MDFRTHQNFSDGTHTTRWGLWVSRALGPIRRTKRGLPLAHHESPSRSRDKARCFSV